MQDQLRKIEKLLVANRGEIAIRVLRAASELRIRTVAMYTFEDRYSLHRYKADEAYQIGSENDPLKPYLDIEEIINLAILYNVDAIHPGYGFLSENVQFAKRCKEEGIIFVGPEPEVMEKLGDKVNAKAIALEAGVPIIQDSERDLDNLDIALEEAKKITYPIMVKAAAGGGGRGMRIVKDGQDLIKAFPEAKNEALTAFGDDTIFLEKFIDNPKHIEVQIMGDNYGSIVHLFERDCSVQRRFQKVVEIAPCLILSEEAKNKIYEFALRICRHVKYNNVGTVEFLVDKNENIFFIEVNPRIQVEHTITEEITGIDIVRSQILIAQGRRLEDPRIYINSQDEVRCNGYAIQCRITTEDPENNFKPDYGTIIAYRNAGGFGIRLDEGSSYPGVRISPFFDSMLVKISSSGRTLKGAAQRLHRTLTEFRIRGVKTNIGFLENVLTHPTFYRGEATVQFIDNHPELFKIPKKLDRGTKTLRFLANVIVNGNPDVKQTEFKRPFVQPVIPVVSKYDPYPEGTKNLLEKLGREKFIDWIKKQKNILYTDTTFRDAHQSLLATRVRTIDMLAVAEGFAKHHAQTFSMEVWGGATFDVSMRFLSEDPWKRLKNIRAAIPNILLQMLLRGSNAVGYKAYPDNLIEMFIEKSWEQGIDIFRIFDSLNWLEAMKVSIQTVRERTGALAEASLCYTGDLLSPENHKYTLDYYLDMARKLEDMGAHIIAIKDMAGLLKPAAASLLISELKKVVDLPVHLHTHDTSSIQSATYLNAIEAGVDVVDVALGAVSGLTSQPNFNSIVSFMQYHERNQPYDIKSLNEYANYWEQVREYYFPFESGLKSGTAEVYEHEIPGGQYSNLRPQVTALGLAHKFEEVKRNYIIVNQLFGDIIKVTPSSKVVGDMAIFMTANGLTANDVMKNETKLAYPESVVGFFKGDLGQPPGGFPKKLQQIILNGQIPYTERPNAHLKPVNFHLEFETFQQKFDPSLTMLDFLSYMLYPRVFEDFYHRRQVYGEVMNIPTPAFFYGLQNNEEILVPIDRGKSIIIKMLYKSDPDDNGFRTVAFELNGQTRRIEVKDAEFTSTKPSHKKASAENEIGAPLQGRIAKILVNKGDKIKENTPLFVIEAMKMETTVASPFAGSVVQIHLQDGDMVEQDDLVLEMNDRE